MRKKQWTILPIISLIPLFTYPQVKNWTWKTFTSAREIRVMMVEANHIWCGTEGGLLIFKPQFQSSEIWTNTEGLASINVSSVISDDAGNLWIGMEDGHLQHLDVLNNEWLTINDYTDYQINDLLIYGDSLFVALDIGISVYLISRREVKETYKHLGMSIEAEIPVYDMMIQENEFWAITAQGISHTRLNNPNLMDPQFWENENESTGISVEGILSFIYYQDTFWTGTRQGIFRLSESRDWEKIPETSDIQPIAFHVHQNRLYAITENSLAVFQNDWKTVDSDLTDCLSIASNNDTLFVGTKQGISLFQNDQYIQTYIPDGPGGNFFSDLAVDKEGALWCCSSDLAGSSGSGFSKFSEDRWKVFNKKNTPGLNTNLAVCVAVDQKNRKWIGTWGKGLMILENDTTYTYFRPENGYLSGIEEGKKVYPDFAVVKSITVDFNGTVWLINRQAYNGLSVVSVTSDDIWTYYGSEQGIDDIYGWDIAVDQFNQKWIGSSIVADQANGVYVYNDSWTPSDFSDDKYDHFSKIDGLLSQNVQAVAVDEDNTVWLGTDLGLNYFTGEEIQEQYDLASVNIQSLLIDGANNLWVGTSNGLYYYSSETYQWTSFNQSNSDLVHNNIISLALDPVNGYIYIGTIQGLSRLKTPFSTPISSFSDLLIYPNPYIFQEHEYVSIENLPRDVSITIFSSQGFMVFQRLKDQVFGNTFIWDGNDMDGKKVASGIYLVVVNNNSGEKRIGKLAIIR